MEFDETSKFSTSPASYKEISEDERDIIDATTFFGNKKMSNQENGVDSILSMKLETALDILPTLLTSPTTATLIKENNEVLCPLARKTGPLQKYCGSYAKLTFLQPDGEIEDETFDSYKTALSGSITCTCCKQCKFCRRLSNLLQNKNFNDAATQTNSMAADYNDHCEESPSKGTGEQAKTVVFTYLADTSDEFYPLSKYDDNHPIESDVIDKVPTTTVPIFSTPIRQERIGLPKPRRLLRRPMKKERKSTTSASDLFLNYLKLLVLRQKQKFKREFWEKYDSAFTSSFCMAPTEVELCRRRFGDGYDVDQLEKMFPMALKSSTPEWRREMFKSHSVVVKDEKSETPSMPKTPADQFIRLDRTDVFRYGPKEQDQKKNITGKVSIRTPIAFSSPISAIKTNCPSTPSKLRPIKMNRTAILRADAIYTKYWGTN